MPISDGYLNPQSAARLDFSPEFFPQGNSEKGEERNGSSSLAAK